MGRIIKDYHYCFAWGSYQRKCAEIFGNQEHRKLAKNERIIIRPTGMNENNDDDDDDDNKLDIHSLFSFQFSMFCLMNIYANILQHYSRINNFILFVAWFNNKLRTNLNSYSWHETI